MCFISYDDLRTAGVDVLARQADTIIVNGLKSYTDIIEVPYNMFRSGK